MTAGNPEADTNLASSPAMECAVRWAFAVLASGKTVRLIDLARPIGGGTPSRHTSEYFSGEIPWITVADIPLRWHIPYPLVQSRERITPEAVENSAARLLPPGSVILAGRVSVGKVAIADVELATNQDFVSFAPVAGLNSRYLAYFLISAATFLRKQTRGTTVKGIRREVVEELRVPVLPESAQTAIAGYLDTLASGGPDAVSSHAVSNLPSEIRNLHDAIRKRFVIDAKVRKIDKLLATADDCLRRFLNALFQGIIKDARTQAMENVAPLIRRRATVETEGIYAELGIRSFGKGTFHKPSLSGAQVGGKKLYFIHPGDLVFNNVFAWEGAVAVARPHDVDRVGSHRFITCVPREGEVDANFLQFFFLTPEGNKQLGRASPGGAGRNRTLGLAALARIQVPVPPIEHQQRFTSVLKRVTHVRELQARTRDFVRQLAQGMPASQVPANASGLSLYA